LFSLSGAKGNRSSCSTAAFSPSEARGEQVIIQFLSFTKTKPETQGKKIKKYTTNPPPLHPPLARVERKGLRGEGEMGLK